MAYIAVSLGTNGHGYLSWWRPFRFANCALAKLAPYKGILPESLCRAIRL